MCSIDKQATSAAPEYLLLLIPLHAFPSPFNPHFSVCSPLLSLDTSPIVGHNGTGTILSHLLLCLSSHHYLVYRAPLSDLSSSSPAPPFLCFLVIIIPLLPLLSAFKAICVGNVGHLSFPSSLSRLPSPSLCEVNHC